MSAGELYLRFDNIFFEKTRLSMLTLLYREERVSFNRFKKLLAGTDGALYSHLKKLIDAEYITGKKLVKGNAVETQYTLTAYGRTHFKKYLDFLEQSVLNDTKGGR